MSKEPLPEEEEGPLCALASILRAIPVVFCMVLDALEDLSSPKPNKAEKSEAFSFPLLCGGLLFLKVVPADWERAIGSGRPIRREFTSEVSLAGDEVFLTLLTVVARQDGVGEECNINPPGALAGLVALVDPCAFAVAGVILTSSCTGIGRFR